MKLRKINSTITKTIFNIQTNEDQLLDEAFMLASPRDFNKKYGMSLTLTAHEIMKDVEDFITHEARAATRLRDPSRTPNVKRLLKILDEVIEKAKRIPPDERKRLITLAKMQVKRWQDHAKGLLQAQGTRTASREDIQKARDVRDIFKELKQMLGELKGGGFMKIATTREKKAKKKPKVEQPPQVKVELPTKWKKSKVNTYLHEPGSRDFKSTAVDGYAFGVFGIHRSLEYDFDTKKLTKGKKWTLTHSPSGLSIAKNLPSKKVATELVNLLIGACPDIEKVEDLNKFRKLGPMFRYILQSYEQRYKK
jgi:hypothetical protein